MAAELAPDTTPIAGIVDVSGFSQKKLKPQMDALIYKNDHDTLAKLIAKTKTEIEDRSTFNSILKEALHTATARNAPASLKAILSHSIGIDETFLCLKECVVKACENNHREVVDLFVRYPWQDLTPIIAGFSSACEKQHLTIVKMLRDRVPRLFLACKIINAVKEGALPLVACLIPSHSIDPILFLLAVTHAIETNNLPMIELLKDAVEWDEQLLTQIMCTVVMSENEDIYNHFKDLPAFNSQVIRKAVVFGFLNQKVALYSKLILHPAVDKDSLLVMTPRALELEDDALAHQIIHHAAATTDTRTFMFVLALGKERFDLAEESLNLLGEDQPIVLNKCLLVFAQKNFEEQTLHLLNKGSNIHAQDEEGNTALHYAVINNNVALANALIYTWGANTQIENDEGIKPADLAASNNMQQLFNQHGD